MEAEDPIGYTFDKDIAEYNLKEMWKNYKENQDNPAEEKQTKKTPKEVPTYKEYSGHPSEFSDDDTTSNSE